MSEKPLVSVIVLSYNYGNFVASAIESVFAQTLKDNEVIVIDNGSTDNTRETAESYGDRIRFYRFEKNVGRSRSRNKGLELARGKYIQFLDADDVLLPDKLKKGVEIFEKNKELMVVYSNSLFIDEQRKPMKEATDWYQKRNFQSGDSVLKKFAQENFLLTHDGLIRREAILQIGGFDESEDMLEDWDLWFRLAMNFPDGFYHLNETLANYLFHGKSVTKDQVYHYKIRKNFVYKHLLDENLKEKLGESLYQLFCTYQSQKLASDSYTIGQWKESRAQTMKSLKYNNYKINLSEMKLLVKSLIRGILPQ